MTENEKNTDEQCEPIKADVAKEGMEKLKFEAEDYKDKYFRALAEVENSRKRLQREKIESQSYAIQNIVCDFLQPLDHFEQALKHAAKASDEIKHWALGFEMMLNQFKQVLADHGVTAFDSVGASFDPHQHEAIETEETTQYSPGTIIEEFQRGYKLGSRVIRPARVKVATSPITTNGSEVKEEKITKESSAEEQDINGQTQ